MIVFTDANEFMSNLQEEMSMSSDDIKSILEKKDNS